ncbi:hypothetical protein UCRPA7_3154 [Phaeoacremonium minimum UCRPA7]|uniref:Uncharacterized protein n=1 Tax=Phaeoacremonium minimum (strain UCR-PA7) TaxID=1286976 RepID=R8BPZ7_PHAM7|nr:hypothetical protein UCRPA7_3154 [Phaeoacremonium minimum UCRPA7]EOO01350.1 hypothetical protein UCRPA7_3154 [Phaeoacremonium minimum UCRPA7]
MTASVASGFSPHSGIDTDESNESFVMVGSYGGTSSNTSSIAYWESPSSGSFQSFAFVGQQPQFMPPSPPAVSPYALEVGSDAAAPLSADTFGDGDGSYDFQTASTNANPNQLDLSNSDINESQEPLGLVDDGCLERLAMELHESPAGWHVSHGWIHITAGTDFCIDQSSDRHAHTRAKQTRMKVKMLRDPRKEDARGR